MNRRDFLKTTATGSCVLMLPFIGKSTSDYYKSITGVTDYYKSTYISRNYKEKCPEDGPGYYIGWEIIPSEFLLDKWGFILMPSPCLRNPKNGELIKATIVKLRFISPNEEWIKTDDFLDKALGQANEMYKMNLIYNMWTSPCMPISTTWAHGHFEGQVYFCGKKYV